MDELLVQYDTNRRATWPLQDAGGDVIALCDLAGVNASAGVLTQIVYDAYGRVIGRDDPATPSTGPPELRVGHKGLFFDRLDAGIFDVTLGRETPRLAPGARLSGYARNRTLHCDFGRWNQADPNATGLPVQTAIGFHGEAPESWVQAFELAEHFGDGPNVREYLGGMAWNVSDPTGLFGILGSAFSMGMNAWDFANDALETARIGIGAGLGLVGLLDDYNEAMSDEVDWSRDWSQPDYLYLRSGIDPRAFGDPWEEDDESASQGGVSGENSAIAGMSPKKFKEKFGGPSKNPNWGNKASRPFNHSIYFKSKKLAKEAAKLRAGRGAPAVRHPGKNDPRGPHWHPGTHPRKGNPGDVRPYRDHTGNPHFRPRNPRR